MFKPTLKFSKPNAKLEGQSLALFNIPAGYTCPGAADCLAKFDRKKLKVVDGPEQKFRCYAASIEGCYTSARALVDHNLKLLKEAKTRSGMHELIQRSMPVRAVEKIRIHSHGDFFSEDYFMAWMDVAISEPERLFYSYTKSLPFWTKNIRHIPNNVVLTASKGGKFDHLIEQHKLREAIVVYHPEDAEALGLEIDHDDSHAQRNDGRNFALLIHNTQPKNTPQGEAIKRLRGEDINFSYRRKK